MSNKTPPTEAMRETLGDAIHFLKHVQEVTESVYQFEFAALTSVLERLEARLAELAAPDQGDGSREGEARTILEDAKKVTDWLRYEGYPEQAYKVERVFELALPSARKDAPEQAVDMNKLAAVVAWLRGQEWVGAKPSRGEAADVIEQLCANIQAVHPPRLDAQTVEDAKRYRWLRDTLHRAVGGGVEVNDEKLIYETPEPGEEVRVFWYPDTPVGFYEMHGSTLDEAIDRALRST